MTPYLLSYMHVIVLLQNFTLLNLQTNRVKRVCWVGEGRRRGRGVEGRGGRGEKEGRLENHYFRHLIRFFDTLESKLGRVSLIGDVRHNLAVIFHSLAFIFIPYNSARENPKSSANPHHLDLLQGPSPFRPFPLSLLIFPLCILGS